MKDMISLAPGNITPEDQLKTPELSRLLSKLSEKSMKTPELSRLLSTLSSELGLVCTSVKLCVLYAAGSQGVPDLARLV